MKGMQGKYNLSWMKEVFPKATNGSVNQEQFDHLKVNGNIRSSDYWIFAELKIVPGSGFFTGKVDLFACAI